MHEGGADSLAVEVWVDGEALEVATAPGPAGDRVAGHVAVGDGDREAVGGGGPAGLLEGERVELPELLERLAVELEHPGPIPGTPPPQPVRRLGRLGVDVASEQVQGFVLGEPGLEERLGLERAQGGGDRLGHAPLAEGLDARQDLRWGRGSLGPARADQRDERMTLPRCHPEPVTADRGGRRPAQAPPSGWRSSRCHYRQPTRPGRGASRHCVVRARFEYRPVVAGR